MFLFSTVENSGKSATKEQPAASTRDIASSRKVNDDGDTSFLCDNGGADKTWPVPTLLIKRQCSEKH